MNPSVDLTPTMANKVCTNIEENDNTDAISTYSLQNVPYSTDLDSLSVGKLITVSGVILKRCKRFSFNFLCSKDPSPDIAFHFNPRLEQRYVVRNCRVNGYWGQEETSSIVPFDFRRDQKFKVDFFISEREFLVTLNGKHWCSFTYRLPITSVVAFDVRGLVDINDFQVKTIDSYPEQLPHCEIINVSDVSKQTFKLPYLGKLSQSFDVGWEIEIAGRPKILPQNFFINLQEGPQLWPHPNVPLHLNPRFCTMSGIDVFVRNAWFNGSWGQEERAPVCPFLAGTEFVIQIRHEYEAFTVWAASWLIAEFTFRCPVDKILYVVIAGDVDVYNVSLHKRQRVPQITNPVPETNATIK